MEGRTQAAQEEAHAYSDLIHQYEHQLHELAGRRSDRLTFAEQESVAASVRLATRPVVAPRALRATAAGPETYLAYADLSGASHYPTNIPAKPVSRPFIVRPPGVATSDGI